MIGTPTGLATGGGSVWVTTQSALRRIDPVRVKEITHRSFGFAHAPVYMRGSVWLIADNELQQIDPITLARREVKPAGSQPASLAAGGGALWAADFRDGRLTRLAADGGRITSLRVGKNLGADRRPPRREQLVGRRRWGRGDLGCRQCRALTSSARRSSRA